MTAPIPNSSVPAAQGNLLPVEDWPDTSHLITEDEKAVDNLYSERQMRLLVDSLYASWNPGRPFMACANVGVFFVNRNPAVVPDVFVSLDVEPASDLWSKEGRSYLLWEKGKSPEVVIEIVSNKEGGELTTKRQIYATNLRVPNYIVWDPNNVLGPDRLQNLLLTRTGYHPTSEMWIPELGLGLKIWQGNYDDITGDWLRWIDASGELLLTGAERAGVESQRANEEKRRADEAKQRAELEKQRADQEKQRAEEEKRRADALAARLRDLGVN